MKTREEEGGKEGKKLNAAGLLDAKMDEMEGCDSKGGNGTNEQTASRSLGGG